MTQDDLDDVLSARYTYRSINMKTTFKISGMSCQNCVRHVTEALKSVNGVTEVEVDLVSGDAKVEHAEVPTELLIRAVAEAGYEAEVKP